MVIATGSPPRCDGRATGVTASDWGFTSLPCNTARGLTIWTDSEGQSHRACRHHLVPMLRRFPRATPSCYFCGRDVSDGLYTRMNFGAVGIQNVCDICDERSDGR